MVVMLGFVTSYRRLGRVVGALCGKTTAQPIPTLCQEFGGQIISLANNLVLTQTIVFTFWEDIG